MGIIKRALKRTSCKLLSKIIPPTQSHQLVLNPPLQANDFSSPTDCHQRGIKRLASLQRKFRKSNKSTTVADALLLAVKNHLPPVQFHHVHGPNVHLSKNSSVALRTQSFCQALVFSNRVILPNERVYIKVLEIAKGWSGTIRFGFTAVDPATLAYRMPKHVCPDMTNAGHTWARALADEVVRRNSVIHFSYNKNGLIHYGINNQDCGVFHANVKTDQNLWFIVDIYGLTAAVELIDPRVNNSSSSQLDISQIDDELALGERATIFKSTSAMDEIFGRYDSEGMRIRKKHSRKQQQAARHQALIQNSWAFDNSIVAHNQIYSASLANMQLPNLNASTLPTAQQNIYSPMPSASGQELANGPNSHNASDTHDYHQIYQSSNAGPYVCNRARLCPSDSMANTSRSTMTSSRNVNNENNLLPTNNNINDLSQRLGDLNLNSRRSKQQPKRGVKITVETPVAATRRLIKQPTPAQVNSKRSSSQTLDKSVSIRHDSSKASPSSLTQSIATKSTTVPNGCHHNSTDKPRSRVALKNQKASSPTVSDENKNNNSSNPPSKDCPICFERPINCVLYQCGHMCTCYECGVKQWKTQSRTCPICRTIIKDVIKTYMS